MSHIHFCDVAGHYWTCQGPAVRVWSGTLDPTPCTCLAHNVSLEEGNHRQCPIELVVCPDHSELDLPWPPAVRANDSDEDQIIEANGTIGFCVWCNQDFFTMEELLTHNEVGQCKIFDQWVADQDCERKK